jgi:hypothetical protein
MDRKIELILLGIGVIVAVIALVPAFGQWLDPRQPETHMEGATTKIIPTPTDTIGTEAVNIDISDVLSNIVPGNGGIEKAAPWWKAIAAARENGIYDPTEFPGAEGCFGVAWNVMGLDHAVVVFQSAQALDFQAGGHYSLICLTDNVELSASDVGRVQSTWLCKEYGGTWRVQVID